MEATYVSVSETPLESLAKQVGKADLIVDATGSSAMAFEAMRALGHNGVLVWTSITGGTMGAEAARVVFPSPGGPWNST